MQILQTLLAHQVDFIVVGAVSAVLQGAGLSTFDIDIVHSREPDNLARLLNALTEMDAHYREQPTKRIAPTLSHLSGPGHQLLLTKHGPLDVLGAIELNHDYKSLRPFTLTLSLGESKEVRVLKLETLIELKETSRRAKDLAALPTLKRTLEELKGK